MSFGPRRGLYHQRGRAHGRRGEPLDTGQSILRNVRSLLSHALRRDVQLRAAFRSSGGSISSGRFVARLLFDVMDYDLAHPADRMPTSFPTRPGTKRSAFTRCGRCATKSPASPLPNCCRSRKDFSSASKICSASAAIPPRQRRSSRNSAPERSMDIRPRRRHSLGYHRRVWRGLSCVVRPGLGRGRYLRRERAARSYHRRRRRNDARPRGRGVRRGRHGFAR